MIRVSCTACKVELEVDDAFAGGVCRCSACGAIQTVPAASPSPTAAAPSGKTLFRKKGQAVVGSGLDELAQVVASSGVHSARLRRAGSPHAGPDTAAASHPPTRAPGRNTRLLIASIAVGMVAGILFFFSRPAPPAPSSPGQAPASAVPGAPSAPQPAFASIDLSATPSVVFLVDRGSSSSEVLSPVKQIVLRSLEQLGQNQQFAVQFWDNGTPAVAFPTRGLAYGVSESVAGARTAIGDVNAFGQSDLLPRLTETLKDRPASVVVITAKGFDLDETWAERIEAALPDTAAQGKPATIIHTVSIGTVGPSAGLKRLSDRTGGTYLELSPAAVRDLSGQ